MDENTINRLIQARGLIYKYYINNPKLMYYYLALSYCREKQFYRALTCFKSAVFYGLQSYLLFYNLGVIYIEIGDFTNSEYNLKKSIALNPSYSKSYINLAYIYLTKGDSKLAYRTIKLGTINCNSSVLNTIENKLIKKI